VDEDPVWKKPVKLEEEEEHDSAGKKKIYISILYFSVFEDLDLSLIMCLCVILVCF